MRNLSFKNKTVVFTGTLQTLTRKQAQGLVYSLHGHCQSTVTKQTDILVCGHYTKSLFEHSTYTNKEQTARELIEQGQDLLILSEAAFYAVAIEQLQQIKNNLE
ncbi:BRCT domain-containing protein [Staphylococcus aureus]|uniref:BRCT domain-containing protein n=1 Tax=Staphylococcus aureus TaxID=1280 RepID=UPI001F29E07F|nr:BRCT domain-containing protein [Staphylococcus aureus]